MANGRRAIPARKRDVTLEDDSLLLRSAESLGRVIGSLQRELQKTAARLNGGKPARRKKPAARKTPKLSVAKKVARKK